MSYAFRKRESVSDGLRRMAQEQLETAAAELHDEQLGRDDAVHQARKRIKKTRSILRLARTDLGPAYKFENRVLRDAGQALSGARDAAVMLATFERLRAGMPEGADAEALDRTRAALTARRDRAAAEEFLGGPIADAGAALRDVHARSADWNIDNGFNVVGKGLGRSYRDGRAAMRTALATGTAESFHEWRKRVKDLWYATRLLTKTAKRPMGALRRDLRDLSEVLGDLHDLDVFAETAAGDVELVDSGAVSVLHDAIEQERERLAVAANALGSRIYAETPKAFTRRLRAYWKTWRSRARTAGRIDATR